MVSRYKPHESGFQRLMLSDGVRRAAEHEAHRIVRYLQATGPRSSRANKVHWVDSFEVSTGLDVKPGPRSKRRAAAFVVNKAPHAAALEFGNARVRNPPRPMTNLAASTHRAKRR